MNVSITTRYATEVIIKQKKGKQAVMHAVRVYRLQPTPKLFACLKATQMEAARVWNLCCQTHKQARKARTKWSSRNELQQATKGQFALHSQSVQMVVHAFLAAVDTTCELRQTHPQMKMKYPWREKRYYPVKWPAQAVSRENGRVALPMGNGRKSLVLPLELPENSGACTLVWNNGFELHVCVEVPQAETTPGGNHATVDLGENHLAAVTTNTGRALIVTGRGIRSLNKVCKRSLRRVRDVRHNAIRQVIDFCTSSVVESAAQPLLARSAEPPNKK